MFGKIAAIVCAQALFARLALTQCVFPGSYLRGLSAGSPSSGGFGGNAYERALSILSGHGVARGFGNKAGDVNNSESGVSGPEVEQMSSNGSVPDFGIPALASELGETSETTNDDVMVMISDIPMIGFVTVESIVPTSGVGVVNYGGNGMTTIASEAGNSAGAGLGVAGAGYVPGVVVPSTTVGYEVIGGQSAC